MIKTLPIPYKYRGLVVPVLVFVIIVLLSVTLTRQMVRGLLERREDVSRLRESNKVLEGKREKLSSISVSDLTKKAQILLLAVPEDDSTLLSLSSMRQVAVATGVSVRDFKAVKEASEAGIAKSRFTFEIEGNLASVVSFIKAAEKSLPLLTLQKLAITNSASNTANSDIAAFSFWAKLPKSLPKVDSPLEQLTQPEEEMIAQFEKLPGVGGISIEPPQGRSNPFSE